MEGWYENAGVRGRQRRILHEDQEQGLVLFPHAEIPYLRNPAVAELPPDAQRALVARHLYAYLLFTVHLETKVVNRGTAMVAHNEVDFTIGRQARLDALKIYTDEAYHALYNLDIVQQIEQATGIDALPYDFGPRLDRLDRTIDEFLPGKRRLGRLLQVVVFETMVTSILADLPRDPCVYRVVRHVVADHARDETHHHAFFTRFFRELWTHLPSGLRPAVAQAVPHLIDECLRPDLNAVHASLRAAGLTPALAADVVDDSYTEAAIRETIRNASRHTRRLCESVGAFDLPGVEDRLGWLGLLG